MFHVGDKVKFNSEYQRIMGTVFGHPRIAAAVPSIMPVSSSITPSSIGHPAKLTTRPMIAREDILLMRNLL